MSGIDHIDTVGAWLVHRFATEHDAEITGLDADGRYLLEQVSAADAPVAARAPPPTPFTRVLGEIGDAVVVSLTTLYGLLGFLGATTLAFWRSEEHTSELQSLMRLSYAVLCL